MAISCKRFSEIFYDHPKFWTRECLGQYFSFDLEIYSKIYQNDDYKEYIQNKMNSLPNKIWRQHFEQGEKQKSLFSSVLSQIGPKEQTDSFVIYFFQTLKEPSLPLTKLKRETIIRSTQTMFQNKLSEVLYEDSLSSQKNFNFCDENKSLIDGLQKFEDRLFQEALIHDKNEIVKARWYILDRNNNSLDETISFDDKIDESALESPCLPTLKRLSNASTEDLSLVRNNHSYLISLYDCLQKTLILFCGLVLEYLNSLDNGYDLLVEYSARWKTYVCSMLELEKTFATFTSLMNTNYETIFEGYPSFPKFSIWRMMTRIWIKEVYEKAGLNHNLHTSFVKILTHLREENIIKALEEANLTNNANLPKSLYVSLQTKDRESFSIDGINSCSQSEMNHSYFSNNSEAQMDLLAEFLESVMDISLTEVSIHYVNSSELPVNSPYHQLEETFLVQSKHFYDGYQPLFKDCAEHFCEFLKLDWDLFSGILIQRTQYRFEALHLEQGLQYIKTLISGQLHNFNLQELVQSDHQIMSLYEQRDELGDLLEQTIRETVREFVGHENISVTNNACFISNKMQEEFDFFRETQQQNEFDIDESNFINKAALLIESKYKNLKNEFTYLGQKLRSLEQERESAKYIKQDNLDKNIPFEMSDVDCLFYDLEKELNLGLLEKLYEDYVEFAKQQEKESANIDALELERNQNIGMEINGNFEQNLEGDLVDDLDFLNLDTLQLRRTLF